MSCKLHTINLTYSACFKSCEILGAIPTKRWGKHPNTPPHHLKVNRNIFLRKGHDGVSHAAVSALGYTYVSAIFLLDCRLQPPKNKKQVYAHKRLDEDFATYLAVCLSWGASQRESSYCHRQIRKYVSTSMDEMNAKHPQAYL